MGKINHILRICLLAWVLAFAPIVSYAQSSGTLISEAEKYYEAGRFRNALQYFLQGGNLDTWNKSTKLKVAISYYAINDMENALRTLLRLVDEGKTEEDVFFYLARSYQQRNQFQEAIVAYKQFLKKASSNDPRLPWVKDEILRCAVGKSLKHGLEKAYVENLGPTVNSFYDEFSPAPSPNHPTRIYLSAAKEDSKGGIRNIEGVYDSKFGHPLPDIYYTELKEGKWSNLLPLPIAINTPDAERISTFNLDGSAMYFYRGRENYGAMRIDSFSVDSSPDMGTQEPILAIDPRMRDLFIFNDTILLFSSDTEGGYGGYDLYSVVKSGANWGKPRNLGPAINSHYDEITPFLARDGRMLFYSSNNRRSIGGFDIFRAVYDDERKAWRRPSNMGLPVNSAGDDAYWKLTIDGLSGFFSSDRKTGYGKRDIYIAYLKEQAMEQLRVSHPVTFIQVAPNQPVSEGLEVVENNAPVKEYFISNLYYEGQDQVLTPQNIKKLNLLLNMLKIYPSLKVVFTSHDVSSGPKAYDLYFSIKKAEKAAEFLIGNGINANRVVLRGVGAQYPLARAQSATIRSPLVDRLNKRVEIRIENAEDQPLKLIFEKPTIPDNLKEERGARYRQQIEGLVYRIQIAAVNHLYQNPILEEDYDALVEFDPGSGNYRYLLGMTPQYAEAVNLRDQLRLEGFSDAFIVPYVNDRRLTKEEITRYTEEYGDLLNYLDQ